MNQKQPYIVLNGRDLQKQCETPLQKGSAGAWNVTSRNELLHPDDLVIRDAGNGTSYVASRKLGKSFFDAMLPQRTHAFTMMLGAICGDVAGSVYEFDNIKEVPDPDHLVVPLAHFTDDSVMTLGVAEGIMHAMQRSGVREGFSQQEESLFLQEIAASVRTWGLRYPRAGYGRFFLRWLNDPEQGPYQSWGNGSAMRASYAGYAAKTLEDAQWLAKVSACITHDHPKGIEGAQAVAGGIWLLRQGSSKEDVLRYARQYYDMNFTLDAIREEYCFDVSCEGSVPQAIRAFWEGNSFEEVLALAISIGGDSDTIAAIAGSLAELVYPIPEGLRDRVLARLDPDFKATLADVIDYLCDETP